MLSSLRKVISMNVFGTYSAIRAKYIAIILIGVGLGAIFLGLESVESVLPPPFCDRTIAPFPVLSEMLSKVAGTGNASFDSYLALRDQYAQLKTQAVVLRFSMEFLDHGFLYVGLPAMVLVFFEQFKKVRAVDCIRRSLELSATCLLAVGTTFILLSAAQGKLPVDQSFDQMIIRLLCGLKILLLFSFASGVLPLFLLICVCVLMIRWKPEEASY